jgi:hypothetical protein
MYIYRNLNESEVVALQLITNVQVHLLDMTLNKAQGKPNPYTRINLFRGETATDETV